MLQVFKKILEISVIKIRKIGETVKKVFKSIAES